MDEDEPQARDSANWRPPGGTGSPFEQGVRKRVPKNEYILHTGQYAGSIEFILNHSLLENWPIPLRLTFGWQPANIMLDLERVSKGRP